MRLTLEQAIKVMKDFRLHDSVYSPEIKEAIEMATEALDYELRDRKVIMRERRVLW